MSKKKLDSFHYHESLDRTHLILSSIEDHLLDHPVFENHKKLRKKVQDASDLLMDVYQTLGTIEYKKNSK